MSQVIFVRLSGDLGDQLFQYAAARALSEILGGTIVLEPAANTTIVDYRPILFTKSIGYSPMRARTVYTQSTKYESWTPDRFRGTDVIYAIGWFQYLPAIRPILPFLREEVMTALHTIRRQLIQKYSIQMRKRAAFIHIYRGNAAIPSSLLRLQDESYYVSAMERFDSRKAMHWYVISNDVGWCKRQSWLNGKPIIEESELHTLAFMTLCEGGAVLSNHALGWWGAVLSGAPTVYPSISFEETAPNLYFPEWIKV